MTVPRATANLGRTVLRRAATQTRSKAWRQLGRRNYASEHGQKSSELPWILGSVGVTVPAAVWLLGQTPQKDAHHDEEPHVVSEGDDNDEEESTEETKDEGSDEGSDEAPPKDAEQEQPAKDDSDDSGSDKSNEESSDESSDKSSDEGKDDKEDKEDSKQEKEGGEDKSSPNAPGQINTPKPGKGPGEQQKGDRRPTERKGEKDAHSDYSGAQNPYLDDHEKSKKGEGVKETQKIHGTVDSTRPAR